MRWKSIIKIGIVICAFLAMTIECKTNVVLAESHQKTIKLFRGDFDAEKVVSEDYMIKRQQGEDDAAILTELLKMPSDEPGTYVVGIPNEAKIKMLKLNKADDCVVINMTKDYALMNYGSRGECLALQSLANTVMSYYNVHKAIIELEGNPYVSGHVSFEKNESVRLLSE